MIKYSSDIDNRKEYYLPLIDNQSSGIVNCEYRIPLSFYLKYGPLFKSVSSYIEVFKRIDIDKLFDDNKLNKNYDDYCNLCSLTNEIESINEELHWILEAANRIDFTSKDIEFLLKNIERILFVLEYVYPRNYSIYDKSFNEVKAALNELKNYSNIHLNKEGIKYKKIFLPDSWFILPDGSLYNTGNGHKNTSLIYDLFYDVKNGIEDGKLFNGTSKYYYELHNKVKEEGFTRGQFKAYLNYKYDPYYGDNTREFPTCHEPNTLKHILGVIKAKYYFYKYIEELQANTFNTNEEFHKLMNTCNNDIGDIFVRCCGFHKINSTQEKTITTSSINYEEEFSDFIERGWSIQFIPPIIINKENGYIEEYPTEFLIIRKMLRKQINMNIKI